MSKPKENLKTNSLYVGLFVVISILLIGIGIGSTDDHFFIRSSIYLVIGIAFGSIGIVASLFFDLNQSLLGAIRHRRAVS